MGKHAMIGKQAPALELPSTTGGTYKLPVGEKVGQLPPPRQLQTLADHVLYSPLLCSLCVDRVDLFTATTKRLTELIVP